MSNYAGLNMLFGDTGLNEFNRKHAACLKNDERINKINLYNFSIFLDVTEINCTRVRDS